MQLIIAPKETEVQLSWEDAMEYCDNLKVDGYTNWRLPTRFELQFLIETQPTEFDCDLSYWTSTERNYDSPGAEFILCSNCDLYQSCWKEQKLFVRAIRRVKNNKQ